MIYIYIMYNIYIYIILSYIILYYNIIYIRAKPLSRRRLKLLKTAGFVTISGNFQWKNVAKRHLTTRQRFFLVFHDIQCSFATLKASDGDSFTIPAKQSFL